MTIEEYLDKIEAFQIEKTKNTFSDNADLELYIQEIKKDGVELNFVLNVLWNKQTLNDIVNQFSDHSGLLFVEEQESGNVCFANSDEVRPEFRQSFKWIDLLDYIYAFAHSSVFNESPKIIITSDNELFWKLVKIGSTLRKESI